MTPRLHLTTAPIQRLAMTLALQQALRILQMPQIELAQWIRQEIDKNPLLEELPTPGMPPFSEEIAAPLSLHDHLLRQIRETSLTPDQQHLARQLLHHLDDKGFLALDPIPPDALSILPTLQTFDPPGIFARSLQEALLLQLKALGESHSPSYSLIRDCFDDLLHRRYKTIEKKLGPIELVPAIQKLARLSFRPASAFQKEPAPTTIPDLRILKVDQSWFLEIAEEELPRIQIHPDYASLTPTSPEERTSLREWTLSAKWLLRSLKRRRQILLQIGTLLIRKQAPFLEQKSSLTHLTIQQAAQQLDLHESTLSRALADKYAATPRGILPLRSLFTSSPSTLQAKETLKHLITSESKQNPLTDDQLATQLHQLGHPTARRTIAKYRKQLRIPPASTRKHLLT